MQRHVYLFSDVLVVLKKLKGEGKKNKKSKRFLYICQLPFASSVVSDVKDGLIELGKQG